MELAGWAAAGWGDEAEMLLDEARRSAQLKTLLKPVGRPSVCCSTCCWFGETLLGLAAAAAEVEALLFLRSHEGSSADTLCMSAAVSAGLAVVGLVRRPGGRGLARSKSRTTAMVVVVVVLLVVLLVVKARRRGTNRCEEGGRVGR